MKFMSSEHETEGENLNRANFILLRESIRYENIVLKPSLRSCCSVDRKKISSERLLVDYKDPDESQDVVIMLEGEESKLQFNETDSEDWVRFCFLAPTGAQGVKMCVCLCVCVTFFKREL